MEQTNYYDLLDISMDASVKDIRRAYKKMALMYHPDKVSNLGQKLKDVANEEMKKLNNAKDVLLNEGDRQAYDASLRKKEMPAAGRGPTPGGAPDPGKDEIMQFNNILISARKFMDDLRKINGDVREAENFFIQAKYAVNKGELGRAIELAQHSKESAKSVLYKYAVNVLLLTKEKLVKHRDRGVNINVAFDRFLKARNAMMQDNYLEAVDISVEAVNIANEIAKKISDPAAEAKKEVPQIHREIAEEKISEPDAVPKGYVAKWDEESHQEDVEVYKNCLKKVWADGVVTKEEQDELDQLKEKLGLGKDEQEKLEKEVREGRRNNIKIYMDAMMKVLEDGIIDDDEHDELASLRDELKLEKDSEFYIED